MAFLLLAAVVALASPNEQANEALRVLNQKAPPVGYVFLLDTSAAMEKTSKALREEVAALVEVVPAGDVVEVIAYHIRPFVALKPTTITEAGRADLVTQIRALELPSGYDRDLGAGLDVLARDLSRADAPRFQHAFVVSTFCHAPPVSSAWSSGGRGCSPIRNQGAIGQQVSKLVEEGRLAVRLFPVAGESVPVDPAGLDSTVREFGGAVVPDNVSSWLKNWRARLVAERIAPIVASDIKRAGIEVSVISAPTSEQPVATIELRSTAILLDLDLEGLVVEGAKGAVSPVLALSPAAQIEVPVAVPRGPLSFFPRHDTVDVRLGFTADGQLGPASSLKFYGYDGRRKGLKAEIVVPMDRSYGLSPVAGLSAMLAVFVSSGLLAVYLRGRLMPLRLGGEFSFRARGGQRTGLALAERVDAPLQFVADGTVRLCKPDEATVVIRVRRPLWRMSAEVVVRTAGVEINGKPVPIGVHAVVPGAVSIRFGETRLNWE